MPIQEGWKLLPSSSHFMSLRSKPLLAGLALAALSLSHKR
jgi:hypothetical protein